MGKENYEYSQVYLKIGRNIKQLRMINNNMSQEDLAFKIGSARNYIGCIERAEKRVTIAILCKIAEALNVTLEEIIKGC